jgi:hypothetical protein
MYQYVTLVWQKIKWCYLRIVTDRGGQVIKNWKNMNMCETRKLLKRENHGQNHLWEENKNERGAAWWVGEDSEITPWGILG